jgi:hypothetical protein
MIGLITTEKQAFLLGRKAGVNALLLAMWLEN